MTPTTNGVIEIASHHSVDETVDRLKHLLETKGITLFALVDHSGEAEKVGMKMPPTKLLIFGNPKVGTPMMLASPGIALDLPMKILIAESPVGQVHISFNDAQYLSQRHNLSEDLLPGLSAVATLASRAAE